MAILPPPQPLALDAVRPPSSKLAALAGLLAGLRGGVNDIQQSHAAEAARAQQALEYQQKLKQQEVANQLERERIDISRRNAEDDALTRKAAQANTLTDNTNNVVGRIEAAAPGMSVPTSLGAAIYGRQQNADVDPIAAASAQPFVKETPTPWLTGGTEKSNVAGVPMDMMKVNPLPFKYDTLGNATTQRLAAADEVKAQQSASNDAKRVELNRRVSAAMGALPTGRALTSADIQKFNELWRATEDPTLQGAGYKAEMPREVEDYMKTQQTLAARPPVDPSSQAYKEALLQQMQDRNAPLDIAPDIETTETGRKYVDLGKYTVEERKKVRDAAHKENAAVVTPMLSNKLKDIDTARMNQRDLMADISATLPKDASGRVGAYPNILLSKALQSEDARAAYGAWRTTAISTLKAMVGGQGSGLRINQAEIAAALENDIPQLTDTLPTAIHKFASITKQLNNVENGILGAPAASANAPIVINVRPKKVP